MAKRIHTNEQPIFFDNSDELCKWIADYNNKYCFCSFSLGIDSIAMMLHLRKYFEKIVPIYMYIVPNLDFVNNSINYFEHFFNKKIIQVPHPKTATILKSGFLQISRNIETDFLDGYDMDALAVYVADCIGYPPNTMMGIGNRKADNPIRHMSMTKYGVVNYERSTFYPIFDFTQGDVNNIIKENNCKIPIDYEIFGRSFDGLVYRFSTRIKERFPEDYEKIKVYFPLIDIEVKRAELANGI